ncbi:4-coumarate--CoA ligase [Rhodobacter capsulatus]|nr:4-coumarate--CoA ligase [Rhodobacter capsulatus DE442]ETE54474.1 4-coumarate--CoA ligase [Rhodobacter capsulatus Y262]
MNSTMPEVRRAGSGALSPPAPGPDGLGAVLPQAPDAAMVRRLLISLIRAEARRGRNQILPEAAFTGDPRIDEEGLGFDSLARLDLIGAVRDFFDLSRTGIEDYVYVEPTLQGWIDRIMQHFDLLAARSETAQAVFRTSGSTGTPKPIPHPWPKLMREAASMARDQGLVPAPGGAVIGLVPAHHLFGCLFTALLPELAGAALRDLTAAPPASALRTAQPGDLIIATPHLWAHLGAAGAFPPGLRGVSSGAPMPDALWHSLLAAGLEDLTEVYGASETGGIGLRRAPGAAFTLLPFLSRSADDGISDGPAPLPLQDRLRWTGPVRFVIEGRLDQALQVGGVNVRLGHVKSVLEAEPGVEALALRLGGDRLKAFVVCAADAEAGLEARLRARAEAGLDAPARPQHYRFGRALPLTREGKARDWD